MNAVAQLAAVLLCGAVMSVCGCREVVVACAADGTCPDGTACMEGVCKTTTGGPDVAKPDVHLDTADSGAACSSSPVGGPTPRSAAAGGVAGDKLVMVGGDGATSTPCEHVAASHGGVWELTWCKGWASAGGVVPSARVHAASASRVAGDMVALFGGRHRSAAGANWLVHGDLWSYQEATGKWQLLAVSGPPGRASGALAVSKDGDIYLQGGDAGNVDGLPMALADTWRWSAADEKWKRLILSGGPGARYGHAMAITRQDRYLLVVGGTGSLPSTPLADVWRLDLEANTWQQLPGGGGPSGRIGAGLLAIPGDPRLLFFGGRDASIGARNDLWVLDVLSGSWELAIAGDLGANGGGITPAVTADNPCAPPAGYMTIDSDVPPPRSHFVWGYQPHEMQLWLSSGRGSCGPLRDAWTLHLPSVTWRPHEGNTAGWSCARRGGTCASLCTDG